MKSRMTLTVTFILLLIGAAVLIRSDERLVGAEQLGLVTPTTSNYLPAILKQPVSAQTATSTPTATATSTAIQTPTRTPTASQTAPATTTQTPTITPTATQTPTITPTATQTPTITQSPSATPTATQTPTLTPTATETPTATPTATTPAAPLYETVLFVPNLNSYTNTPDDPSLDLGTGDGEDFTIEAFFHVSDLSYDPPFLSQLARKDESYSFYVSFNDGAADWLSFQLWTGAGDTVTLSYIGDLSLGWHHVAAVYDNEFSSNEDLLAIYLDGNRVANSADENIHVDWTPGIPNSANELSIGGVPFGSAGFGDFIEEIRFSDVVRYAGTTYPVPTSAFANDANTRGLWHFDEVAGSTIFVDSSGNGNTLTGGNGAETHNP